ncbi:MAG TPA: serine/threonine-protein kinase [Pirellulales bacterium]|nr:serine/threonine-protein kinase [Pirellulales bacterium]
MTVITESSSSSRRSSARPADEALGSEAARAMALAWQNGRRPGVEDLLVQFPALASAPRAMLRLISEELLLRRESGEDVDFDDILARFPQWRAELELLLACHELFEDHSPPEFPQAGEACGEFILVREIGRGSQGRVFLASQPSLCDRPVVVKLVPREVAEHLSLARLQHTGIVPLYLAQDLPEQRLRLLCMPFMGGASLAAVLTAMKRTPLAQRSGQTIADALVECHAETTNSPIVGGPALDFLRQASYVQAVCWLGACLAEALHFAHQRGLVHFDVKPSNLLLAGDGQPMLLDFHLARGPIAAHAATPEWVGGTAPYMPPEQAAALAAVREVRAIETTVDARADVYSLAIVIDELLSGNGPLVRPLEGAYGLRHINASVTCGLSDLLAKCLSPNPQDRYADAQSLADDLRRHLADLPLRGVRNRSPLELWRKWRRRRPRLAVRAATLSMASLVFAVVAWWAVGQRVDEAQQTLIDGQQLLDRQAYRESITHFERGLERLKPLPGAASLKRKLRERLDLARRIALAAELHQFVQRLRFIDGGSSLGGDARRAAEQSCQTFWSIRDRLIGASSARSPALTQQVRADLLDLLIFWLDLRSPLADAAAEQQQTLELLDQAEVALGASEILLREQRLRTGEAPPPATDAESSSAAVCEQYALARSYLRRGDDEGALAEFRRAVRDEPQDFWANFYRGQCAYRLHRYDEALGAFSICVALAPGQAECFYNRGLASAALGQTSDALVDFDRAIKLDPTLTAAAANRDALRRAGALEKPAP